MRATLLVFLVAAFEADIDPAAPTFDPEENELVYMDEYTSDALPEARFLQVVSNSTNNTVNIPEPGSSSIPLVPLALVGLAGAGTAGYFMTRTGYTYETYDYDHAADSGLLDHEDYDVEYDDGEDYDYDEDYEGYE